MNDFSYIAVIRVYREIYPSLLAKLCLCWELHKLFIGIQKSLLRLWNSDLPLPNYHKNHIVFIIFLECMTFFWCNIRTRTLKSLRASGKQYKLPSGVFQLPVTDDLLMKKSWEWFILSKILSGILPHITLWVAESQCALWTLCWTQFGNKNTHMCTLSKRCPCVC